MADLATKAYINLGEAQPPCWPAVADGDCNHDGVFNITDFGAIPDLNHNGVADPEDLILNPTYNNGHDDDHDGYVDDISGWDFLYGDNDPLDTVDYGHGTGEAKDSSRGGQRHRQRGHLPELPVHPGPGGRLVHRRRRSVRGRRAVRARLRGRRHPGGARRAERSPPGPGGDRRRVPPRRGGRRVDGRRGVEAPEPARPRSSTRWT